MLQSSYPNPSGVYEKIRPPIPLPVPAAGRLRVRGDRHSHPNAERHPAADRDCDADECPNTHLCSAAYNTAHLDTGSSYYHPYPGSHPAIVGEGAVDICLL